MDRAYEAARKKRTEDREILRLQHPYRHGRAVTPYPANLSALLLFMEWLPAEVQRVLDSRCELPEMVKDFARLPSA